MNTQIKNPAMQQQRHHNDYPGVTVVEKNCIVTSNARAKIIKDKKYRQLTQQPQLSRKNVSLDYFVSKR